MIRKHCDGPDCTGNLPVDTSTAAEWLVVTNADLRPLDFCGLLCACRFLSTALAFMEQRTPQPWTEPELPLS